MIGPYGDTDCSASQARQTQIGAGPIPPAPALATEFEMRVRHLQLTPDMYASSRELRDWCRQNRNRVYIPEWLLEEWRITVDALFGATA